MSTIAETNIKNFIGDQNISYKNIKLTMFNVNIVNNSDEPPKKSPKCQQFIDNCVDYYPKIMEKYKKSKDDISKFLVPFWFSPSSQKMLSHPKSFDGDHTSEEVTLSLGCYSTEQIFAIHWDNSHLCAVLGNKNKYSSKELDKNVPLVEDGYTITEVENCINRGIMNTSSVNENEYCRYVIPYLTQNKKTLGLTMICGDHNFLSGASDILLKIKKSVDVLYNADKGEQPQRRKGVSLNDVQISKKPESTSDYHSQIIARLLGSSILIHDHLTVLKAVHGVKKVLTFDASGKNKISNTDIDMLISEYARIKKYWSVCKQLNFIK